MKPCLQHGNNTVAALSRVGTLEHLGRGPELGSLDQGGLALLHARVVLPENRNRLSDCLVGIPGIGDGLLVLGLLRLATLRLIRQALLVFGQLADELGNFRCELCYLTLRRLHLGLRVLHIRLVGRAGLLVLAHLFVAPVPVLHVLAGLLLQILQSCTVAPMHDSLSHMNLQGYASLEASETTYGY